MAKKTTQENTAVDIYDFDMPEEPEDKKQPEPENDELSKALAQNEEYLATLKRLQADFDNFRKRNQTIRSDSFDDGIRSASETLLPVLDNLYRAIETHTDDIEYQTGVKMIADSFVNALELLGVTEIETDGNPFDPSLHEAILQQEAEDAESETIMQTAQKGYIFKKEKVIRAAKVVVAK